MSRKSYSQILDLVAREQVAEQTDLAPRILERIQKGKSMQPRIKIFATAILMLLVLVLLLASVPAVRAAIQRWIGYVPGIGLVSEGQLRVLAEPVSITRDGITLRVERVLADSTQTTLVYSVDGLSADRLASGPQDPSNCHAYSTLRFPSGELTNGRETTSFGANGQGYQNQVYYPALPAAVHEATLVISCFPSTSLGKAPENWELSFRLASAPSELTALPVIEISAPVTATTLPLASPSADSAAYGVSLSLDRVVSIQDGYLLYATLAWGDTKFGSVDVMGISTIRLLNAQGEEIPSTIDLDAAMGLPYERGKTPVAIRTEALRDPGPLRLVIDSAQVVMGTEASFRFDPGPNPRLGQVWELDQNVDLGDGHSLRVWRVTYSKNSTRPGFSFEMESETGVSAAILMDMAHPLAEGPGLQGQPFAKSFSDEFYYAGALPEGPITVNILSAAVLLPAHWEAQWTPPTSTP